MLLALFVVASFVSSMVALSGDAAASVGQNSVQSQAKVDATPKPLGPYGHYYCGLGNVLWSGQLWTPVMLLNSPYGGNSQSYSGESYTSQYSVAGFSSSTSSFNSFTINASNGGSTGLFQLDTWTIYATQLDWTAAGGTNEGCSNSQTAEITSAPPIFFSIPIMYGPQTSDANEPTTVSYSYNGYTYPSIAFDNSFNPNTWNTNSPNIVFGGSGGGSFTSSGQTMDSLSFSITEKISGAFDTVVGALTTTAGAIWSWSTFSYHYYGFTYTIPSGYSGYWEFQALAGGNAQQMGYAINYVS